MCLCKILAFNEQPPPLPPSEVVASHMELGRMEVELMDRKYGEKRQLQCGRNIVQCVMCLCKKCLVVGHAFKVIRNGVMIMRCGGKEKFQCTNY